MSPKSDLTAAPQQLPAPRFANGWAALVYALATLTLAYPALWGRFMINPRSDQYIAGYAFREFGAQTLRAGEGFPQWNPYLFGGMPYIAAMHGDIFYPTFLLRMIMPTDVAMTWTFVIHLFLAGFFTFGFLRAWGGTRVSGSGFYGALLGGLAYMLSGPIAGYASPGHDGKLFVSALLPLTLWMLVRGIRDGRAWAWGGLAITIGLAVLSPHPQLLQYLLLASGAFALFLAFGEHGAGKLPRDVALRRLVLALCAVILGGIIGAVQYLPLREYVDWSPRAGGQGYAHAISYSMPIEELFNAVVPEFTGLRDNYWGRNQIHLHSEYPGVVVLTLAGAGMLASTARRSARWFWTGVLVVSLLWTLGGYTPFYRIIYEIVPGTKFFRAPSTMMFLAMFSLAVLAALGTERVLQSAFSKRFLLWPAALVAVAVLAAAGLAISVADAVGESMAATYQGFEASQMGQAARDNQPNVVTGAIRSMAVLIALVAVLWAVLRQRLSPRNASWLLAVLVTLDLWSVERRFWIFSARARELFRSDPAIDYMKRASEPGRVIQWAPPRTTGLDRAFTGDLMMTHGIRSAIGYHGNELGRYQLILDQSGIKFFKGERPEFWRHENVHYLYTTVPDSLMPQVASELGVSGSFTKLVGPVQNFVGSTVYLYRVPGENPAAWVATAMVKATDEQALGTVLDPRYDPTRFAIVDTSATIQPPQLTTAPAPAGVQAKVTRYDPGRIDIQLDKPPPAGAALVVSENFFPGWRAAADGRDANVARANFNLIAVVLPAGARNVQLRFRDSAYETGKTVTLIALALAIAAAVVGLAVNRRRLTPA
jgi:hypothetical protein